MLRLYNTLTGSKEDFHPIEEGVVKIYTCGPTVYDYAHIGNFRTFVFQDILCRYLRFKGYRTVHVMNITDVDDRIIQNAKVEGVSLREYTDRFTEAFLEDSMKLRIEPPGLMPRATEHIPEMVALIRQLQDKGLAYEKEGSIYFGISRFPGYGKLSRKDFDGMQAGARIDSDIYDKDDVRDFVLWKARKEGEAYWDTELGPGRPGWHIECSAMSMKYLGESFDIHCGGVDLVFPHHENEIAQSEGATGKPFARYWIHPEFLLVEGEKMAKSKGNQFTLRDLLADGHSPEVIRYLLLSVSYRRQLNFTIDGLRQAQASLQRLEDFTLRMRELAGGGEVSALFQAEAGKVRKGFIEAMDDDINTSAALAAIFDFVRSINLLVEKGAIGSGDAAAALAFLEDVNRVFGVMRAEPEMPDQEIMNLIKARQEARRRRDFAEADRIRDFLVSRRIQLEDTRDGVRWKRIC